MEIPKVGKDVSSLDYWAEKSATYGNLDGGYHAHRLSMIKRLIANERFESAVALDLGCGEGVFLEYLARQGAQPIGFDPCEKLVEAGNRRLRNAGIQNEIRLAGLDAMVEFDNGSLDYLFALNVLAYFTDSEEEFFYRQAARVLRPNGTLVVTHSNELFDMYTFNKYTVAFFRKHFGNDDPGFDISSLLVQPQAPNRVTFNVRENPANYRYKLARYGFEEKQQEFANLHPAPPLLMDSEGFEDIDARDYADTSSFEEEERWKLMFMCSMFGSRSVKR